MTEEDARSGRPFVGRDRELQALAGPIAAAVQGQGAAVLVSGEAGIGKTRLVVEAAARADRRFRVAWGHCYDGEGALPFRPWIESLRQLVHGPGAGRQSETLDSPAAGALTKLVSQPTTDDAPPAARLQFFDGVTELLASTSRTTPVLLVMEDLHWADASTLDLLRHVGRRVSSLPLVIIGTYRDSGLSPDHPLRAIAAEFIERKLGTPVRLHGLKREHVGALVRMVAPQLSTAQSFADALTRHSGGNPFFLEELLRYLEAAEPTDAVHLWDLSRIWVPATVEDVLSARLGSLPAETVEALEVAATLGDACSLDLLSAVLGASVEQVDERLAPARAATLIGVSGKSAEARFLHGLVAQTVRDLMPQSRRRDLHLRAAAAIAGTSGARGRAGEVYRHLRTAGPTAAITEVLEWGQVPMAEANAAWAGDHVVWLLEDMLAAATESGIAPVEQARLIARNVAFVAVWLSFERGRSLATFALENLRGPRRRACVGKRQPLPRVNPPEYGLPAPPRPKAGARTA